MGGNDGVVDGPGADGAPEDSLDVREGTDETVGLYHGLGEAIKKKYPNSGPYRRREPPKRPPSHVEKKEGGTKTQGD